MKLRNKKTGEIINNNGINFAEANYKTYNSLTELNTDWEDYEEPKEYWFFNGRGKVHCIEDENTDFDKEHKVIGNYFESEEEAEKAVEKLKAWKRLKDKGFKLDAVVDTFFCLDIFMGGESYEEIKDDLKIVFGGEDE